VDCRFEYRGRKGRVVAMAKYLILKAM
jgi:hypothetical protein